MVNSNLYEDQPYLPHRDPREVNIVERLKEVRETDPVYINDEELQHSDLEREVSVLVEKVVVHYIEKEESEGTDNPGGSEGGNTDEDEGEVVYRSSVVSAATLADFPPTGSEDLLYLATTENDGKGYLYRWCTEQNCYLRPEDSADDISLIEGGDAFSDTL